MGIKVLGMILFLAIVPFLCGIWFTRGKEKDNGALLQNWVIGFVAMQALAQLMIVPATFLHLPFHVVCIAFYAFVLFAALSAAARQRARIAGALRLARNGIKGAPLIVWAAVILAMLQACVYIFCAHEDADDSFYVATAVTSVEDDSLYEINPYTGDAYQSLPSRYVLSPFPVFTAILSRCAMLHPAAAAHTALPFVLVCFTYAVYALIGRVLFFGDREKTDWLVFLTGVFLMFSGYTTSTQGSMALLRIWQGKGFLAAALLLLLIWQFLGFVRNEEKEPDYALLSASMLACCLASSMGILLGAILLGLGGILVALGRRSLRILLKMALCALPNLLLGLAYVVIR